MMMPSFPLRARGTSKSTIGTNLSMVDFNLRSKENNSSKDGAYAYLIKEQSIVEMLLIIPVDIEFFIAS